MKTSSLYTLNFRDFTKGLIVAVGGAVIATVETSLQAGSLIFNWKSIGAIALAAGLSYLGKNFFTSAQFITPVK